MLRSDLAMQEPGDATLGVPDADVTSYLATRFLAPPWALDGEAGQQFDLQNAGPVNAWPTDVVGYMFPAGSTQFPTVELSIWGSFGTPRWPWPTSSSCS
jgi:hypothetical protein